MMLEILEHVLNIKLTWQCSGAGELAGQLELRRVSLHSGGY